MNADLKTKLSKASSLEEVKGMLGAGSGVDAERLWREIEKHRSGQSERLDLNELDSVSGGADRDWVKEGCAATVEIGSWCWSNDHCVMFDVTYDNLWATCPDGKPHEFVDGHCVRCGYNKGSAVSPG